MKRIAIKKAIKDKKWQEFRIALKGLPTNIKMMFLDKYLKLGRTHKEEIQVKNYENALLRGGQLKRINNKLIIQK